MSKLEKGISGTDQTSSLLSIAISLKRIADNMERVEITGSESVDLTIDLSRMKEALRKDLLRTLNDAKTRGLTR